MSSGSLLSCRTEAPPKLDEAPAEPAAWSPPRVIVTSSRELGLPPRVSIEVPSPAHRVGTGPRVAIDSGHHNFMIRDNFAPFAEALQDDGFVVEWLDASLSSESLAGFDALVIVNALHPDNVDAWSLPTPSAFTEAEIEPGEIEQSSIGFSRADQTIVAGHPITDGARAELRAAERRAAAVRAVRRRRAAAARARWEFSATAGGRRVATFGEAAMLSARHVDDHGQWFGVGFVHPDARDNLQLVLNRSDSD